MADKAHRDTDKQLAQMEQRLKQIYSEAQADIEAKAKAYFRQFEEADKKKQQDVAAVKINADEYTRWKKRKIMFGEKWTRQKERIAAELADVRSTALAYINGELPAVYATNYNFVGTGIESEVRGYSFDLVNPDTVKELAKDDTTFLPYKEINGRKYQRWCTQKINAEIMKGIMLGDSVSDLAKRLRSVVAMDQRAAVRNARTMVTSAENKARQDGFERAANNGIVIQKEWIAAIDRRTRHAHRELNGDLRDPDQPFDSEFGKIMYPGDPAADPADVYNCRCTLGSKVIGFRRRDGSIEYV